MERQMGGEPARRDLAEELVDGHFRAHREAVDGAEAALRDAIVAAALVLSRTLRAGGTIFACGNGGSAADAQHFAAELVGRYGEDRDALAACALTADTAVLTALSNDLGYEAVFERQLEALAGPSDALVAITTSGGSENVLRALDAAGRLRLETILLTGGGYDPGSRGASDSSGPSDPRGPSDSPGSRHAPRVVLAVPATSTPRIQEVHAIVLHALADFLERVP